MASKLFWPCRKRTLRADEARGRDCVRVAMALTEQGLAATTIRAISPRAMWGFIPGMDGGDRDIMGAGFMARGVFGAFDGWKRLRERDLRAFRRNRDACFLQVGRVAVVREFAFSLLGP